MADITDNANITKQCSRCKQIKPLTEFSKDKKASDGRYCHCRECKKTYYENTKEKAKIQRKTYRKIHKEEKRAYDLVHTYGITLEDKRNMWKEQDGQCAICRKKLTKSRDCHVDHCHITGKIRGLLCHKCNLILGYSNDNTAILQKAIDYLEKKT